MTETTFRLQAEITPGQPVWRDDDAANCAMVIFGASGDLTDRKLVPALYHLEQQGLLPKRFVLLGYARSLGDDAAFRAKLRASLDKFSRSGPVDEAAWERLAARTYVHQGGYDSEEDFRTLEKRLCQLSGSAGCGGNRLFYLSTPASAFPGLVTLLRQSGLVYDPPATRDPGAAWSHVIVEKPFGRDLDSARVLQRTVAAALDESQVYRIDHFLGKETVQNILVLRFGNSIFEPLWNRKHVSHVEITAAEEIGIGDRGRFYEQTGILRDMVQNHLLQVMALCAMEQPVHFGANSIRDEKAKLLRSIRIIDPEADACFGQYDGYRTEKDVAADSRTPTYAALRLHVDNWRWQGVPFFLRTGKLLAGRRTEIAIHFQEIPTCLFGDDSVCQRVEPNVLVIRIAPKEGVSLRMATKVPGGALNIGTVTMDFTYEEAFRRQSGEAYERLILDAMRGDQTLFSRSDEVEEAWKLITPLLQAQESAALSLSTYAPGSQGPAEATRLLHGGRRQWSRI